MEHTYMRCYRRKNRKRCRATEKAWKLAHLEQVRAAARARYARDKERIKKVRMDWERRNHGKKAEYARRTRERRMEAIRREGQEYYATVAKERRRCADVRKHIRALCRQRAEQLTVGHVRGVLSHRTSVPPKAWPLAVVLAKQAEMKLRRKINEQTK